jgi:CBS domain containing-hemolysin-like protein
MHNEALLLISQTILSTLLVLITAEFLPKAIVQINPNRFLTIGTLPLFIVFILLYLPTQLILLLSGAVLKLTGGKSKTTEKVFSKVDLAHFVQQTNAHQEQQELNTDLFENALSLPDIKVRKCLVPRTEIIGVDILTPIAELKALFIETKLSKLIVYNDTLDNIVGYVHQLDLFKKPTEIKAILHPVLLVTESMNAADLINLFSKKRKSIAWVVDEFGGTAGIVTMEDVLEEIFGEINDEYDEQEFLEKKLSANEYIFSGRLELDYLYEKYGIDFAADSAETLSGYLIHKHEAIPKVREVINLSHFDAEILLVSDTRIEKVKLTIH